MSSWIKITNHLKKEVNTTRSTGYVLFENSVVISSLYMIRAVLRSATLRYTNTSLLV